MTTFLPCDNNTIRLPDGTRAPMSEMVGKNRREMSILAEMEGDFPSRVAAVLPKFAKSAIHLARLATYMVHHDSTRIHAAGLHALRELAESGNNVARFNLALHHLAGEVLEPDFKFALSLLTAVAETEAADRYLIGMALKAMGDCYSHGIGVQVDLLTAAKLLESAADLGVADAAFDLGLLHDPRGNRDQPADYPKAAKFYKRAVDLGHVPAMTNLGVLYVTGAVKEPEAGAGWALLSDAAERGDAVAIDSMMLLAATMPAVPASAPPTAPGAGGSFLGSIATRRL